MTEDDLDREVGKLQARREIEVREAYERNLGQAPNIIGQVLFSRAAVLVARFEAAARDPNTQTRDLIALDGAAQAACRRADSVIVNARQKAKAEAAKASKQLAAEPEVPAEPEPEPEPEFEPVDQEPQVDNLVSPEEPDSPTKPESIHAHPLAPVKKWVVY